MSRTVPLSIIRSFSLYTQQQYMSYRCCWQLASRIKTNPSWSYSQAVSRGNCPKHVEFYSKNKFEKSVHLVDFIIRIYRDARSPERQIHPNSTHKCHASKKMKCVSHTTTNSLMLFIEVPFRRFADRASQYNLSN